MHDTRYARCKSGSLIATFTEIYQTHGKDQSAYWRNAINQWHGNYICKVTLEN